MICMIEMENKALHLGRMEDRGQNLSPSLPADSGDTNVKFICLLFSFLKSVQH